MPWEASSRRPASAAPDGFFRRRRRGLKPTTPNVTAPASSMIAKTTIGMARGKRLGGPIDPTLVARLLRVAAPRQAARPKRAFRKRPRPAAPPDAATAYWERSE